MPENPDAADTTTATPDQPNGAPAQDKPDKAEPDWKAEARKWEKRAKEHKQALEAAAPKIDEYDRLIEASKSDLERKAEEAQRWQSEAERWRTQSVASRIHALAASDYADPTDAVSALGEPGKYLDAGGTIDDAAIKHDLAELLDRKPHFRKPEPTTKSRPPAPNPHQGSGAGGAQKLDPRQEFAAILQAGLNR